MKEDRKLFVRIDYKVEGKDPTQNDIEDCMRYLKNIAEERYFKGGVFMNKDGAMVIFESKNFEEAEKITQNDPLIERGLYRYELFEWNLLISSKDTIEQ